MYETFEYLLKLHNVRASDVAKATGIKPPVFSEWKRGRSNPKVDKLQKIADYFGVSLTYLLVGENTEIPPAKAEGKRKVIDEYLQRLTTDEATEWLEYAELLLLRREKRLKDDPEVG